MMTQGKIMQLAGLSVGYRSKNQDIQLIKDIDLEVLTGEVVCLMGQNGVGKSTLLRTLAGIQSPLSGSITFGGIDVGSLSVHELAQRISLVLTDRVQSGNLLTEELVALGRHPYTNWLGLLSAADGEVVEEAITLTRINYLKGKRVSELSDGQYQKAMIARAVAQDGDLMILDEPTAFLDLNNSVEIFLLLRRLAREKNKAIIVSTHDFHLAMEFADKLWLTNFNQPLTAGVPEDLALNGSLEASLYHEGYGLDLYSGRIVLPKPGGKAIMLRGDGQTQQWTKRALERAGFVVGQHVANPLAIISVEDTPLWKIDDNVLSSIADLLAYLRRIT